MIRAAVLASAFSWLALAPYQCGKGNQDVPELRREESAGDALWGLAARFEQEHNVPAQRATLRYLVERYPSNRHAADARDALGDGGSTGSPASNDGGSQ
jgi:TolA-binding protein